jgi:hypothetical protein
LRRWFYQREKSAADAVAPERLLSLSITVQVYTSPAPSGAAFAAATFFSFAQRSDQISSHWTDRARAPITFSSW